MSEQTPKSETDEGPEVVVVVGDASGGPAPSSEALRSAPPRPSIPRPVAAFAPRGSEASPDVGWTPGPPAAEALLAAHAQSNAAAPQQAAAAGDGDGEDRSAVSTTDIKAVQAKKGVLAMRMVRIEGSSGRPPPPPLESETPATESEEEGSGDRESLEQLDDEDVEERLSRPTDLSDELESADSNPVPDLDATTSRRPPPRRQRSVGPPVPPSARAVEKALKAPRFDPSKKRGRLWWEELFTDDFGRAIPPLSEPQLRQEVDFIERSLGVTQEGVVLDLACGTGHHAVEFASRGYNVVGYDLSVSQLAEASERAQERSLKINFLQGDMRELAFENTFDGIYCWNTSFGYFEEEKNIHLARRVFAALKSGGSFLLDVINRDFAVAQQPNSNWFEGDGCVCMDDMSVDFITSRLRVKRTVMLDDGRTRECNYSVRIYGLHELGKILHDIGFKVIQASGHPSMPGVFFGAQSPRVIILAAKP
jgi:SAM-dependent methyltransferase